MLPIHEGKTFQLASADYVSLFDLLVSCVDVHGFEPVLDLESFEVQGVRQLRAVCNPHTVWPLPLVTQVVGMRTTHLKDASVICMQQQSLVLLAVPHGLPAVYVPIEGLVCRINVGIHTQIVFKSRGLVKGNRDAQLKGATQTVGNATFHEVLGGPIGGVASTEEQGANVQRRVPWRGFPSSASSASSSKALSSSSLCPSLLWCDAT